MCELLSISESATQRRRRRRRTLAFLPSTSALVLFANMPPLSASAGDAPVLVPRPVQRCDQGCWGRELALALLSVAPAGSTRGSIKLQPGLALTSTRQRSGEVGERASRAFDAVFGAMFPPLVLASLAGFLFSSAASKGRARQARDSVEGCANLGRWLREGQARRKARSN